MPCIVKKTFECAEGAGAILITQAKDNQKALRKQLEHGCRTQQAVEGYEDPIEKAHGRIVQRTYEVFDTLPMLEKWQEDWPYIRQVIRVTRYREEMRKRASTLNYVSNRSLKATEYARYIRDHWWIENKVNHIKDVAFREDAMTKRCNPYIYSTCIDMALNILRISDIKNIKSSLYKNSLDFCEFYRRINNTIQLF